MSKSNKNKMPLHLRMLLSGTIMALLALGCAPAALTEVADVETPTNQPPTETSAPTNTPEPTATATNTSPPPTITPRPTRVPSPFTLISEEPILPHQPDGWTGDFAFPLGMVVQDGTFYLFRNGNTHQQEQVGFSTSTDLLTWTDSPANPLLTTADFPEEGKQFIPWSVFVDRDGTWVMYFATWDRRTNRDGWFGRATAPAPTGPWTINPTRLIEPDRNSWDSAYLFAPSVIPDPDGEGYVMIYQGSGQSQGPEDEGVGWATSEDGITWQKHPEPVMVRGEDGAWDERFIQGAHLTYSPEDGYVIIYEAGNNADRAGFGIATSPDGITWTRHPANPVFTNRDFPGSAYTHISSIFYHEGTYYLMMEVANGDGMATDIYLATYTGSITNQLP